MIQDYSAFVEMLVEDLVHRCVKVLEREDVRVRIERIVRPAVALILERLYPYIFVTVSLVVVLFVLIVYALVVLSQIRKNLSLLNPHPRF